MARLIPTFSLIILITVLGCKAQPKDVSFASLPEGFKLEFYAKDVKNVRSMTHGPKGVIFVGSRKAGNVYALIDADGDMTSDKKVTLAEGLQMPNGVAYRNGDLYVAEVSRIIVFRDIADNLKEDAPFEVLYDQFPTETHHGWKYIAFGPDGKLYVPVGAPCNVCDEENDIYATITRMDVSNPEPEIVARGVRNSVGFDWHPETKELYFTDNGRDHLGDNRPPCELNHLTETGQHFGFPYCHGGFISDPEFGEGHSCDDYRDPYQKMLPHCAPLGMLFYSGDMFPPEYKNQILVCEHGSWNRSEKIGYRVSLVKGNGESAYLYKAFATGWLRPDGETVVGRPVALLQMDDGSILVSDDYSDCIYRISYER